MAKLRNRSSILHSPSSVIDSRSSGVSIIEIPLCYLFSGDNPHVATIFCVIIGSSSRHPPKTGLAPIFWIIFAMRLSGSNAEPIPN